MTAWSQSEAQRTIEEVKRRSQIDPLFRALALSDPMAALAKVNPRPMPEGSVRFLEAEVGANSVDSKTIFVVLPAPTNSSDELNDDDLEDVAGGSNTPPPPPPDPPVGLS